LTLLAHSLRNLTRRV